MKFLVATLKEADDILSYYNDLDEESLKISNIYTCNIEEIKRCIESESTIIYLLYEDDIIVSIIKAKLGKNEKSHVSCFKLSTRLKYRNQGYIKKLIEYAISDLKKYNIKIIRIKIFSWNKPAIATVEKSGFTLSGRIVMSSYDEFLNEYIDDLLYHKFL